MINDSSSSIATPWLSLKEAAAYLKIEPRTLAFWTRNGMIRGYRLSGTRRITWRFLQSDLDEHLRLTASRAPFVVASTRSSVAHMQ